jgi:hydroxymethylpyrimidine kinase/phosphomethylpyrimidine kinase
VGRGARALLDERGQRELRQRLLPLAAVATPNIPEAEALIGRSIATDDEARDAARVLFDLGARNVIITGGHRNGDADDLLFDGTAFHVFHGQRVDTPHTHGTGCTFSAAVAAGLAQGMDVLEAVDRAKRFLTAALQQAYPIGRGISPVNHRPDNWE